MEYKLVIDQAVVDAYNQYYFAQHPRAKKKPIEKPIHPTMNSWMILPRIQMNVLKQKWKDFIVFVIKYYGYENLQISKCVMTFTTFVDNHRKMDVDAFCPKFILDGMTEAKFLVDDNHEILQALTLKIGYDKENPRTEIIIRTLEE